MLAAGMIVVAHNSAGPKEDIIQDEKYLAISKEDYEKKILKIINMNTNERMEQSKRNRDKAVQYAESAFQEAFMEGF